MIIDYQNLHLVGAGLFEPFKQRHECLVHPLKYAEQLLLARNQRLGNAECSGILSIVLSRSEKGIDVLCALALVREAQNPQIGLVILASQDTDLEQALDEALSLGKAKIETSSWNVPNRYRSTEIRPTYPQKIRNTKMNKSTFLCSLDSRDCNIPRI